MSLPILNRDVFDQVMVPTYAPAPMIPVRGEGSWLWDQQGRDYVDFAGGIAVTCLGHAHPHLIHVLTQQAQQLWHLSNWFTNEPALRLAQKLCNLTFAEKVFFANSGAEANEAALKLARKYAHDHGNGQKRDIIAFHQSFHGRTLFTVSVGGQPKYTVGFDPLPGRIIHRPYNDLAACAEVMSKACAVIVEPIIGEGGVICGEADFLRGLRALCDQHQALLIFDEVQTGVGRTGTLYAYQGLGVVPDILTTAKGLGGGFPIGAMLTTTAIARSFGIGSHGTTYGGNPLACAVAEAVLDLVSEPTLLQEVTRKHHRFVSGLQAINDRFRVFRDIRGRGLLIGAELAEPWRGHALAWMANAQIQGVLLLAAGPDVLRFAPSLIIPDDVIDEGLARLAHTFAQHLDSI